MNKINIKGEGNILKGKVKQAGAALTNDKLLKSKGKSQELLGRVQKKADGVRVAIKKSAASRFNPR